MDGKICLVTGATSGIGEATALALARQGAITIVVGRNPKKSEKVVSRIKAKTGNTSVEYLIGDLSSQKDIRQLSEEFKRRYRRLDVLINNAGGKFVARRLTVDGCEWTFAVNHLAYFLLTNLLLDRLRESEKGRIINVASGSHRDVSGIDFDDLQSEKEYVGKRAYAQSKLANILFTYELARRVEGSGLTANALHPGGVITNFCKNNGWISWLKHVTAHLLARNLVGPAEGAKTCVYLATSPDVEGVTGKYFSNLQPIRSSNASYDKEASVRLWNVSLELTGLDDETRRAGSRGARAGRAPYADEAASPA
jgi:NAD(P)-dependent dehydrogenase (short-subunit alcohol dehydrogenase family)